MTVTTFIGSGLTAFGPTLIVYFYTVGSPLLIIMSMTAAFAWLLATFVTGLLWFAMTPLQNTHSFSIFYALLFQELARYGYFRLIKRSQQILDMGAEDPKSPFNFLGYAYSSGLGFGLASALVLYLEILFESIGPGALFLPSCPNVSSVYILGMLH